MQQLHVLPTRQAPPSQQSAFTKEQCPGTRSSSQIAASVEHTKQSTTRLKSASPSDQLRDELWHKLSTTEKIRMMHRRRRCRTQRRYREKMKDKAAFLAKEVDRMRDEIQHLERMKLTSTSPLRLVAEYFNLFRHGLDVQGLDGSTSLLLDEDHAQKRYLQRVMASDVASNRGFGVQALLEDWRSLSLRHDKLELVLVKLDYGAKDVVVADAKIYTTITERVLQKVLADVDANGLEINLPLLTWKLLGQWLVVPASVRFEWDQTKGQFAGVYYEVDMLAPLMRLLGNVEEASTVMNSTLAIIS